MAPSSYPVPPPTYSGEVVIYDLARSLDEMGHQVDFYAPHGSWKPPHGQHWDMQSSGENAIPSHGECETNCYRVHRDVIFEDDVVHDFSITKGITEILYHKAGRMNTVSTLLGGMWSHPNPPFNIVVWSEAMRQRGLRGASDYEGTPFKEWDAPGTPIKDAHVVMGGTDTEFFHRGDVKDDYFLWMNRWHPAKGYHVAIELARKTGIPLVMAGLHPDATFSAHHRACALDAVKMAEGLPNVRFEWLPRKPRRAHELMKRSLYQRARALLYTVQFQEPFGLAQIEALACGTPVIGTDFGSVPEVINGGRYRTGFVCQGPNLLLGGFREGLESLARAVADVGEIRSADCRMDAQERFDRRVMAENYLKEYKLAMDGKVWGL